MNIENVTLAGMSFADYKVLKANVDKDAAKIIAEAIEKAKSIVDSIVASWDEDNYDLEAINIFSKEANELLVIASDVSGNTGVEYYIEYSAYDSDTITNKLDDIWSVLYKTSGKEIYNMQFYKLHANVEDMQATVREWNSSNC